MSKLISLNKKAHEVLLWAKLKASEVREIRRLRLEEGVGRNVLAERYRISKCHITAITMGRAWRHLLDTDAGEVEVQQMPMFSEVTLR